MSEAASTGRVRRLITRLPPATTSAAEARDFVSAALRSWEVPDNVLCDVVLATSELVTNAIEHGGGDIRMELSLTAGQVLLRVGDDTDDAPVRQAPGLLSERSRGLTIVAALSEAWGHTPEGPGKWVWAQFALPTHTPAGGLATGPLSLRRESAGSLPLDG
ncbi:ATP-binding protein [Actinokineospora inagensis]|uniref:ATP-binding protein n=1 Tax=Actinokineospora inagensis TaxID=103730 RepID=UPI000422B344|nr:ATP-binding protein [Actinokineospora inagensis]